MSLDTTDFSLRIRDFLYKHIIDTISVCFREKITRVEELDNSLLALFGKDFSEDRSNTALNILADTYSQPGTLYSGDILQKLSHFFDEILEEIPETVREEQISTRFRLQKEDRGVLRFLKALKVFFFHLSRTPHHFLNAFRKEKQPIKYWKHTIPLRKLYNKHFYAFILPIVEELVMNYSRLTIAEYVVSKKWSESFILDTSDSDDRPIERKDYATDESLKESFHRKISEYLNAAASDFDQAKRKVGTLELSPRGYGDKQTSRRIENTYASIESINKEWGNTAFTLLEDWRLDVDLYVFKEFCRKKYDQTMNLTFEAVDSQLLGNIDELRKYLDELSTNLKKSDPENISRVLKEGTYQISKKLIEQKLPIVVEKISNQNLLNALSHLDQSIKDRAMQIGKTRKITTSDSYELPLPSSQLHSIAPYELVNFSLLPKFEQQVDTLKGELFEVIERVIEEIPTTGQTLLFSYQSAKDQLLEDPNENRDLSIEVASEGIERVRVRLEELYNKVEEQKSNIADALKQSTSELSIGLLDLTINQNIFDLRLSLTKAKTIQRAKGVRIRLKSRLNRLATNTIDKSKTLFGKGREMIIQLGNRFVLTAKKPVASRAVSDFLIESQTAIDELPLIYRKLYKIEPIHNMELFEGRHVEVDKISRAYANWQKGRYASVVITGEKWGGKTSLINFAREVAGFTHKVQLISLKNIYYDQPSFYREISNVFELETFSNQHQIIDYLNRRPPTIIVVEDIQNLFVKKVGGFSLVKELLEIITRTEQNIFWITSCTKYSWSYMVKTISIDQFFSYNVALDEVSEEQIIDIISQRNKISGFKIRFDPSESIANDKKFQKLDPEEQQIQLKKAFFKALHDYSRSNISMSLLFWLLSTKTINKREVRIGTFEPPDLNFISILSGNNLLILYALILHDGLTEQQLQDATRIERSALDLQLHSLLEDGLLYRQDQAFFVNPLVYRNTVSLLKSRNLIH